VEIITQDFNMNAFLQGDIDAAQAMTYNEYAQLLEAMNPDTGELYQPEDFNVISYEDTVGAMLQDAIWADTARLESDTEYQETTVAFLKAVIKGWMFAAENPERAAEITIAEGSGWGPSHELWMVNETNKLIWPSPNGIGIIDEAAFERTVAGALSAENESGARLITTEPPATAWTNEWIQLALDELIAEGIDVTGASFEPIEVELLEGGN
jgi:NitT/TauT family transport system substrate-binding protein